MGTLMKLDDGSREILVRVRKSMIDDGIRGATFADAVRRLDKNYLEEEDGN